MVSSLKTGRTGERDWRESVETSMVTGGDERGAEAEDRMVQKKVEHITEQGRVAEIWVDLELQAKALISNNKVSGPEDCVVSEITKQLPLEKFA